MSRVLRFTLDDKLYDRVSEQAEKQGLTVYHYVRRAIRRGVTDEECEENKEMNEECEEESYRTIKTRWPAECSGCLYRAREYVDEIDDYVECIHPIFSRQSYQCPVRMTAMAKKKFGRTKLDDYI